jgi:DNA topoisomerase IA
MTALYLCEKPSQARDIARVLGATQVRMAISMAMASG